MTKTERERFDELWGAARTALTFLDANRSVEGELFWRLRDALETTRDLGETLEAETRSDQDEEDRLRAGDVDGVSQGMGTMGWAARRGSDQQSAERGPNARKQPEISPSVRRARGMPGAPGDGDRVSVGTVPVNDDNQETKERPMTEAKNLHPSQHQPTCGMHYSLSCSCDIKDRRRVYDESMAGGEPPEGAAAVRAKLGVEGAVVPMCNKASRMEAPRELCMLPTGHRGPCSWVREVASEPSKAETNRNRFILLWQAASSALRDPGLCRDTLERLQQAVYDARGIWPDEDRTKALEEAASIGENQRIDLLNALNAISRAVDVPLSGHKNVEAWGEAIEKTIVKGVNAMPRVQALEKELDHAESEIERLGTAIKDVAKSWGVDAFSSYFVAQMEEKRALHFRIGEEHMHATTALARISNAWGVAKAWHGKEVEPAEFQAWCLAITNEMTAKYHECEKQTVPPKQTLTLIIQDGMVVHIGVAK